MTEEVKAYIHRIDADADAARNASGAQRHVGGDVRAEGGGGAVEGVQERLACVEDLQREHLLHVGPDLGVGWSRARILTN